MLLRAAHVRQQRTSVEGVGLPHPTLPDLQLLQLLQEFRRQHVRAAAERLADLDKRGTQPDERLQQQFARRPPACASHALQLPTVGGGTGQPAGEQGTTVWQSGAAVRCDSERAGRVAKGRCGSGRAGRFAAVRCASGRAGTVAAVRCDSGRAGRVAAVTCASGRSGTVAAVRCDSGRAGRLHNPTLPFLRCCEPHTAAFPAPSPPFPSRGRCLAHRAASIAMRSVRAMTVTGRVSQ
eukprot:351237-Chlamydomonas_euryale.AAC.2